MSPTKCTSAACRTASVEQNTVLNFNRSPRRVNGRISAFFLPFGVFNIQTFTIFGEKLSVLENNFFSEINKFVFSGQMRLKIIAQLLKNARAQLKGIRKPQ